MTPQVVLVALASELRDRDTLSEVFDLDVMVKVQVPPLSTTPLTNPLTLKVVDSCAKVVISGVTFFLFEEFEEVEFEVSVLVCVGGLDLRDSESFISACVGGP
jgi:hypothetical protein